MQNNGLDLIVRRQRHRSLRDLSIAVAIVVLATLGLGALSASADTMSFERPAATAPSAR